MECFCSGGGVAELRARIFTGARWCESLEVPGLRRSLTFDGVVFPGFVSAHAHLDLWYELASAPFYRWIHHLIAGIRDHYDAQASRARSLAALWGSGVRFVGDIARVESGDYREAGMLVRPFCEFIRELPQPLDAARHYSPHSLYTVAPELIGEFCAAPGRRFQIHLAESREEYAYFARGDEQFYREYLRFFHIAPRSGDCLSPVRLLDDLGGLSERGILVHMGAATGADLDLVAKRGAAVVSCPASNAFLKAPMADLPALDARGIRWALGTDGRCSRARLDFLEDYRLAARQVGWQRAFEAATIGGAAVLGLEHAYALDAMSPRHWVLGRGEGLHFDSVNALGDVLGDALDGSV